MNPQQDEWIGFFNEVPGEALLDNGLPRQMRGATGGWGTTDRSTSMATQNQYGYDTSHRHRRYAAGPIPGNYMWLIPAGRPMVKSLPGPARPPVGKGSPFQGQETFTPFAYDTGAILQNAGTSYVPPPTPYTVPVAQSAATSPEIDLW